MAFTFIGTIIGAGFASGQEIRRYFVDYGGYGLVGLILVSILFIIVGEKLMIMGYAVKSDSYDRILGYAFRCKFKKIIDFLLCVFLVATASTMFSGTGAFFYQVSGLSPLIGSLLMTVVAAFVTIVGIGGIMKISTFIVPILIVITSIISVSSISGLSVSKVSIINEIGSKGFIPAIVSAVIYGGYNFVMGMPVLVTLGNNAKNKKEIRFNSIIAGTIIGVFGVILYYALYVNYSLIQGVEIPIVALTSASGFLWYSISFVIAVFTTAVGCLFGVYSRLNKNNSAFLIVCVVAYIFSLFGFSNLVANLYFIMGIFGVFIIFMLIRGFYKSSVLRKVN